MNPIIKIFIFSLIATQAWAWNSFEDYPAYYIPYHPVSTNNEKAQEAFNQGMLGIYAFNYEGAFERFEQASQLDPDLAMAYWGMAMALDEKYSPYPTDSQVKQVYDLGQKAKELSKQATASEKAYINALLVRLSDDPKADRESLRKAYAEEMKKLVQDFPDDPDGLTLYAESMMDLLSWDLWTLDYKPRDNTLEIISILQRALSKDPYHVGANHYFIHAIENSDHPEYALMSAERLDQLAFLFDDWSHLLHTPSHIYMKVGYYHKAIEDGKRAIKADKKYALTHKEGDYAIHGLTHNLSFLIMAYLWSECYEGAVESATLMADSVRSHIKSMPGFQYHTLYLPEVYLYFKRYDELLKMPEPPQENLVEHAYWHFTRGLVYSRLEEVPLAEKERSAFLEERSQLEEAKKNYEKETFKIAEYVLDAALAYAKGDKRLSRELLKNAIKIQDELDFLDWYEPLREQLGVELIEAKLYAEAEENYRQGLLRFPLNCRLLRGLASSLKAQGKESFWASRQSRTENRCGETTPVKPPAL